MGEIDIAADNAVGLEGLAIGGEDGEFKPGSGESEVAAAHAGFRERLAADDEVSFFRRFDDLPTGGLEGAGELRLGGGIGDDDLDDRLGDVDIDALGRLILEQGFDLGDGLFFEGWAAAQIGGLFLEDLGHVLTEFFDGTIDRFAFGHRRRWRRRRCWCWPR